MADPHPHTQPIETYGLGPHNRNIWPHNSRATAAPSRLADSFVCFSSCTLITTHDPPVESYRFNQCATTSHTYICIACIYTCTFLYMCVCLYVRVYVCMCARMIYVHACTLYNCTFVFLVGILLLSLY